MDLVDGGLWTVDGCASPNSVDRFVQYSAIYF